LTLLRGFAASALELADSIAFDIINNLVATGALVALVLTVRFITRGQEYWSGQTSPAIGVALQTH
jgi:hypothetical protein